MQAQVVAVLALTAACEYLVYLPKRKIMKKILLAACLLTATLPVITTSNAQQTKVQADKKLPFAVEASLNIALNNRQMNLVSYTFTTERNVYVIDFIGSADYDATGARLFLVRVYINNRGTILPGGSTTPLD